MKESSRLEGFRKVVLIAHTLGYQAVDSSHLPGTQ